jgi:DNA primase
MPVIESRFDVHHMEGDEAVCRCPWHDDEGRPNLYVNSVTGLYLCFSCGAKGKVNAKQLPQEQRAASMRDRLKRMSARDERSDEIRTYPDEWLGQFLPHPYWTDVRGFSPATVARFDLGYDPQADKLTIPIRGATGSVLGVIYRRLDNEKPKYLHPKGFLTGQHLFGSHLIGKHKKVAIVEGPLDAIACWDAGIPALAAYGARLTDGQARLIRWLGIQQLVVMTDNDTAGRQAVYSVKAGAKGIGVLVGEYEPHWAAKDPGELSKVKRKQMYHSAVPFHVWRKR